MKYKPDDNETKRKLDTLRAKVKLWSNFRKEIENLFFEIIRKKKQHENWNMDQVYHRIYNRMFVFDIILLFIHLWIERRKQYDCLDRQRGGDHQ